MIAGVLVASEVVGLVVHGCAGDLVVGVEEGFGEQRADVPAAEAVYDPLALSLALDQAGEAQLGQVLAGDRGAAFGDGGEAGDIEFGIAQRPEHADSGGVGEQREGGDCGADLFCGRIDRVFCRRGVRGAQGAFSGRRHERNCTGLLQHLRIYEGLVPLRPASRFEGPLG